MHVEFSLVIASSCAHFIMRFLVVVERRRLGAGEFILNYSIFHPPNTQRLSGETVLAAACAIYCYPVCDSCTWFRSLQRRLNDYKICILVINARARHPTYTPIHISTGFQNSIDTPMNGYTEAIRGCMQLRRVKLGEMLR